MPRSVGILTFHHANNYGAVLQAYGLAQAIRSLGHTVRVIDYRPLAARKYYGRLGLRTGKTISTLTRRLRFWRFRRDHLPLTFQRYLTPEALAANPPDFDCIISGSDQVWNTSSYRGFDPPFFLDFVQDLRVTKASYAATFGGTNDLGLNRSRIAELLRGFDHISVRDLDSQNTVHSLIGRKPLRVLDPSFLADFDPITAPPLYRTPYIAVYCLERTPHFQRVVEDVHRKLGLPLISIVTPIRGAQVHNSASPPQWLSLLKHASFVVTNSFHGLCFSIINRKNFLVVSHSKARVRFADLVTWLNLGDRLVVENGSVDATASGDLSTDYSGVTAPLDAAIDCSRNYLREVLDD